MSAPETWPEILRRHELEKMRAIHAHIDSSLPKAAANLEMSQAALGSYIYSRGLRWNRASLESAYPELTSKEAD